MLRRAKGYTPTEARTNSSNATGSNGSVAQRGTWRRHPQALGSRSHTMVTNGSQWHPMAEWHTTARLALGTKGLRVLDKRTPPTSLLVTALPLSRPCSLLPRSSPPWPGACRTISISHPTLFPCPKAPVFHYSHSVAHPSSILT